MAGLIFQYYFAHGVPGGIGGKYADWLDYRHGIPLLMVFGTVDGIYRLEFVFDYYGIRYHLLMLQNSQMEHCRENMLLTEIAKDPDDVCHFEKGTWKCLDLFWPIVAEDSLARERQTTEVFTFETRFQKKETIKIQLLTKEGTALSHVFHNERSLYPLSEPIVNPCPTTVRVYDMGEIELLVEVWINIFKAKIGDDVVCVKAAPANELKAEIDALMTVPCHPNVIHPLLGVVCAGDGHIDKLVMPFIEGKRLSSVKEGTADQKEAWKDQISDAISSLHKNGLTWGDAAPRNVMIDKGTGQAILIDLGLSNINRLEGSEHSTFESERKKDLAALVHLNEVIDNIGLPNS